MMKFLMIREQIRKWIGKCNGVEKNIMRFLLTFLVLFVINAQLGYNKTFSNHVLITGIALVCAMLPAWVISLVMSAFILAHFSCVSLELTIFTLILLLLMGLLYFSFHLGNSWIMVLSTLLSLFDACGAILGVLMLLPYGISGVVPVCCGILIASILIFVPKNYSLLFAGNSGIDVFDQVGSFFNNQTMLILLMSMMIAVILIYSLRKMSFNHVWYVSLVSGGAVFIFLLSLGVLVFEAEIDLMHMILSTVLGILFSSFIHMLDIILDYSRIEYSQFEDDEYYYYVKAVPKISVAAPDKKIKTINKSRTEKLSDKESTNSSEEVSGSTVRIIQESLPFDRNQMDEE